MSQTEPPSGLVTPPVEPPDEPLDVPPDVPVVPPPDDAPLPIPDVAEVAPVVPDEAVDVELVELTLEEPPVLALEAPGANAKTQPT
jgi:hypothetical protein